MRVPTFQPNVPNVGAGGGFSGAMAGALQQAPKYYKQMVENKYLGPLLQQALAQQQAESQRAQAQANNAGQYYQGQASTAQGVGGQELSGAQYANATNAANIQNTQAQAAASQATANATPYNTANNIANTLLNHHVQQILANNNMSPGGQAFQKFITGLEGMPLGGNQNAANFMSSTSPMSNSQPHNGNNSSSQQPSDSQIDSWPTGINKQGIKYKYNPNNPNERYKLK